MLCYYICRYTMGLSCMMGVLTQKVPDSQVVSVCVRNIHSYSWKSWLEGWIYGSLCILNV